MASPENTPAHRTLSQVNRRPACPFTKMWVTGFSVVAVLLRAFFLLYTHRTWEDSLITVLHAENAVNGIGLTLFHTGQPPVHGFTSPLGVLVPLIGELIHRGFGLAFIKWISVLISPLAVWLGASIAWRLGLHPSFTVMVAGFLAIEHHQMLWGVAGMETQIAVVVLLFSIWSLLDSNPVRTGVALGLCLLARPDFAFWAALAGLVLFMGALRVHNFRDVVYAALTMVAVYLPWIIFTIFYYGSPVPNTIRAKYYGTPPWNRPGMGIGWFVNTVFQRVEHLFATVGPSYGGNGTGFTSILGGRWVEYELLVLLLAGLYVFIRRRDRTFLPIAIFLCVYAIYYIGFVPVLFGWYCVPMCAVTILGIAYGADALVAAIPSGRRCAPIFVTAYLSLLAAALFITIPGERHVQQYVEDGGRRKIGEYLRSVASPGDDVGCEPLGYIAYYSHLSVYDYPGLANRQVMEFLRDHPDRRRLDLMLGHFHTKYVVLRRFEFNYFRNLPQDRWLTEDYSNEKEFSVSAASRAMLLFPEDNIDLDFVLLHRNVSAAK